MHEMEISDINQNVSSRYRSNKRHLPFYAFSLACAFSLSWAWWKKDYRYLQAESGLGYALGIVGCTMMLVLLLYPMRKRLRVMRSWLTLNSWFRMHMLLGVLGPLCILLHCNFQLGSTNSTAALVAMLLVAGSGLVGRYFYGQFHYGLYGKKIELQQLKIDLNQLQGQIANTPLSDQQQKNLGKLFAASEKIIDIQQTSVSLRDLLRQRQWLRKAQRACLPDKAEGGPINELREQYQALASVLDRLAGLRLFERLFGIWHVVHIPIFILMILTASVHIVAVHWY